MWNFVFIVLALMVATSPSYASKSEEPFPCLYGFLKIGCYSDHHVHGRRPLPNLIMTDRDPDSKVFSGILTDWENWDEYIDDLACRCAEKVHENGYLYFGLQNYGECWAGGEPFTANRDGLADTCVTRRYEPCVTSSKTCVGKGNTNYVYNVL